MVAFPAVAALIAMVCTLVIARDAVQRPRPDKIAWVIAFAVFAIAAGTEVVGHLTDWTPTLARLYYATGAVLIVAYLALGELYLLAGKRIGQYAPGVTLLITAVAGTLVINAPVDQAKLATDGWEAIERGTALKILAISLNAGGTLVVVGGALYSAWKFKKLGIQRHRMIGCFLIALGTLVAASGGTLTRLGQDEYLYIGISAGVAIIFAGVLETRRVDAVTAAVEPVAAAPEPVDISQSDAIPAIRPARGSLISIPNRQTRLPATEQGDPAIAFIESSFLTLDEASLSEQCRIWSVPRTDPDALSRDEARQAWSLRLRLSEEGRVRFDALSGPAKRQLSELAADVLLEEPPHTELRSRQRG